MAKRRTQRAASRAMRQGGETTRPRGKSQYAKKYRWLRGRELFGFNVPEPKPWKG